MGSGEGDNEVRPSVTPALVTLLHTEFRLGVESHLLEVVEVGRHHTRHLEYILNILLFRLLFVSR